jgi:hypothetical protein
MKQFTVSDIQEIIKIAHVTGVEQFWCQILFKGGKIPCNFLASPTSDLQFSKDVYKAIQDGVYGDTHHGTGEWYVTQPKEQLELEQDVRTARDDLLLRSDYIETAIAQAKLSDSQKTAWAEYRDALRNITKQANFPYDVEWPVKPN